MDRYGFPPSRDDCAEVPPPDGLVTVSDHAMLTSFVDTGMVPGGLGRPLTNQAVARQLIREYADDIAVGPVCVTVPKRGTFYLSEKGWCVE